MALARTSGPILELGIGDYSTPIIHEIAGTRPIHSFDTSQLWANKYRHLTSPTHTITHLPTWSQLPVEGGGYGLAFLDHVPLSARVEHLTQLRDKAAVIVVHAANEGDLVTLCDSFPHRLWFKHLKPWPSCIVSQTIAVEEWATLPTAPENVITNWFRHSYVIHLADRPDRRDLFSRNVSNSSEWPFRRPLEVVAVNGHKTGFPSWWKQGGGAWGCLQSHARILEHAIAHDFDMVLHLEDDAFLTADFRRNVEKFLRAVPDDWDMLYLGGQHLKPPKPVEGGEIVRCTNVNRTHAFAVRNKFMRRLYQWIMDPANYHKDAHVDHCIGKLTETTDARVYAPVRWLVGQDASHSDIAGKEQDRRLWGPDVQDVPCVAVLGPFRGGTSVTAGILHHLGVHMGNTFMRASKAQPSGFFEAVELGNLCRKAWRDGTTLHIPEHEMLHDLRVWMNQRKREAAKKGTIAGGKHPSLCMVGPRLMNVWGSRLKVIAPIRPTAQVVASVRKRGWRPKETLEQTQAVVAKMLACRDETLKMVPHFEFALETLRMHPVDVVKGIVEFLELKPTTAQMEAAIAHVEVKED